jgi:hypothetical protein
MTGDVHILTGRRPRAIHTQGHEVTTKVECISRVWGLFDLKRERGHK